MRSWRANSVLVALQLMSWRAPTQDYARANSRVGARQVQSGSAPTACQLCANCMPTCANLPLYDPTRLPRPHVLQVFVCAPCSGHLSSWRHRTTATGARGCRAFAKPWGRPWGHIGKCTHQTRPPPHPPRLRGEQTPNHQLGAVGRGHSMGEPQKWQQRPQTAVQPGPQPMEVPMGNPDAGAKGIVRPPRHGGPFSDRRGQ